LVNLISSSKPIKVGGIQKRARNEAGGKNSLTGFASMRKIHHFAAKRFASAPTPASYAG